MAKPLSKGALQGANWITPTGYAEEAYQADKLKQYKPMPIGPAGLPIPLERAIYRSTIDGPLLKRLCTAAYRAHLDAELAAAGRDTLPDAIVHDLQTRFPAADMEVLSRYGLTTSFEQVRIELIAFAPQRAEWIKLPTPVVVAKGTPNGYAVQLGGKAMPRDLEPPAEVERFGRALFAARATEREFNGPLGWASPFKARNGRWPRWIEIERAHPRFGAWLAGQRKGIRIDR